MFPSQDMVSVLRVPDPSIEGVTLFISNVERPITDRISKDFFGDPSGASVCGEAEQCVVAT